MYGFWASANRVRASDSPIYLPEEQVGIFDFVEHWITCNFKIWTSVASSSQDSIYVVFFLHSTARLGLCIYVESGEDLLTWEQNE